MSNTTKDTERKRRACPGFSLVELLIVIVVLGVLATVTVFAVRGITDRGERSSCLTDARTLSDAADVYLITESVASLPATGDLDGNEYERTLVDAGLVSGVSSLHDLVADGSVTVSDSICV